MFNKRVGVFYTPIKHDPWVYWTTSKTFLEKRVSMELITMTLLWTLEISIRKKHYVWNYYARKSNLTRCWKFSSLRTTLTEDDIASCSRAFRKPQKGVTKQSNVWSATCFKIVTRYTCGFSHVYFQSFLLHDIRAFFATYTCVLSCFVGFLFPSIWPFSHKRTKKPIYMRYKQACGIWGHRKS